MADRTRRHAEAAWGNKPLEVYAATETAGIASECDLHRGMHLFEDLVITEVVDEKNKPVPPGVYEEKVLVTVLFSRTMPLIRYEMSDSMCPAASPYCPCGRPFALSMGCRGVSRTSCASQLLQGAKFPCSRSYSTAQTKKKFRFCRYFLSALGRTRTCDLLCS